MDLASVILFLVMYYIRPQEWSSVFSSIHFVQIVMGMAIMTLFFREKSLKFGDLLKTPHDWMMLFFFMWMIGSSPSPIETFKSNYAFALFYIVIVQTLTTIPRMKTFVGWWTFLIVAIAALAIASEYGFDPRNSYDITHGHMKNRLILNLSIFNNPNGLGHSVVPCIPMLYFFAIWKRPLFMKEVGFALLVIPIWCIYLTVSKGAFLVGGLVLVATMTFGRPRIVQIIIVAVAIAGGGTLIYKLPRMNELAKSKTDGAIQGRVAAFKHGMALVQTSIRGCGRDHWMESFYRAHHYTKACHSSYVQVGGELGVPGLGLYLGILYCCVRTLLTAKTRDADEERIRRTLFVLVFSYMASSWMVDFGFRPTFFMFAAAVAALHRHLYGLVDLTEAAEDAKPAIPAWRARLLPPPALAGVPAVAAGPGGEAVLAIESAQAPVPTVAPAQPRGPVLRAGRLIKQEEEEEDPKLPRVTYWKRLGAVDLIIIWIATAAAIKFWQEMIKHM